MKLFIDNNLPHALAKALHELSAPRLHEVWHLKDMFAEATPDHEWISALAEQNHWIIVTQDRLKKTTWKSRP